MARKKTLTTCIYCGSGCQFYLDVEDNKIKGVVPSQNHPVSQSSLCVKGWNAGEFVNHPDRLTDPLIKENGAFRKASWDEALNLVVKKLIETRDKYGNDSVAFFGSAKCTNEENYLIMKLARAVFKTNNIDHCARLCHASTVAGLALSFGSGAMTNSISCFDEAELYLITGSNTTEQHPLIGSRMIKNLREKKADCVVIDPRKIKLSRFAKYHLKQNCGTDVAWMNGLMHVIIKEGLENKDFIRDHTENYEELKKTVEKYTPEYVEKITSIPAQQLKEVARLYATKKSMIIYSMGITQHTTGVDNVKSCANLAMLTGNIGKIGTGVNPLRGQNNVQGSCDVGALPNVYCGYQAVTNEAIREKFEKAWKVKGLSPNIGLTVTTVPDAILQDKVKALYVMGENPMVSDPNTSHLEKALLKCPFLVVQDIFLTETAQLADVVLPGVSYAEKDGTFTSTERRVERIRKAVEPIGNAKPDWKILCEIADHCGYKFDYASPKEVMDEMAQLAPIYGGITYDRKEMEGGFGLQWPCPTKDHPGTAFLHKDGNFTRGKGLFFGIEYKPPAETGLDNKDYPLTLTTGRSYFHWHTRTLTSRTSTLEREVPENYIEIHPEDAKKYKVRKGSMIKVSSLRGSIEVRALVSDIVKPGTVFMPFHFAISAANRLTNDALDPIAKIPEYKVCAVKIGEGK